jgi:hypothetical protein
MNDTKFNIWNAYIYEALLILRDDYKLFKNNKLVSAILAYCKPDWVLWKVQKTLKEVDTEIDKIKAMWDKEEPPKFEFIEHEPDGSKAQELLGGAIEIRSTFKRS